MKNGILELMFIFFGSVVCRIFGHAEPNDMVKTYSLAKDHSCHWDCPRCGGTAHGTWGGGA